MINIYNFAKYRSKNPAGPKPAYPKVRLFRTGSQQPASFGSNQFGLASIPADIGLRELKLLKETLRKNV